MICQWFSLKTTRTVFSDLASKPVAVVGFLVEPQNQGGGGFLGLGLKTFGFGLVIWASKSPRWFLGLSLKIKQATVCRLRDKTDGRIKTARARIEIYLLASPESKSG